MNYHEAKTALTKSIDWTSVNNEAKAKQKQVRVQVILDALVIAVNAGKGFRGKAISDARDDICELS